MSGRAAALLLAALVAALALPPAAAAELGPVRLLSKSPSEQADEATAPAISADGRYVAFQGSIGGRKGVFREDVASGAIENVVSGVANEVGSPGTDARDPSISADGRFVAFTTTARLDPADDTQPSSSDVYVADLAATPPSYRLASALDNCAPGVSPTPCGLSYEGTSGGSQASPGVALSADGSEVAFVTTAASNLGGVAAGTPAGQVLVRDLDTNRTTLVSAARDLATGAMQPDQPVPGGAVPQMTQLPLLRGAAISADGTTVAWPGANLPAQVPMLADERATVEGLDENPQNGNAYYEPLWRRIADGAEAPTRRIVGGGDPLAPGCPGVSGILAEAACRGPFPNITGKATSTIDTGTGWMNLTHVDGVPRLSPDGREVALIGNPTEGANVFLVDMAPGLSRVAATRQLTREIQINPNDPSAGVNVEPNIPLNGHVFDLALAADGKRIAFATARQRFPLAPPNLVGSAPTVIGLVELYLIDLEAQTLRRVTHGAAGASEPSRGPQGTAAATGNGATSPSLNADGTRIAFASDASNLVESDGNDASDAFLVEDSRARLGAGGGAISAPPQPPAAKAKWQLRLSAVSLPRGGVRVVAVVPAAGTLRLRARSQALPDRRGRRLVAERARARRAGKLQLTLRLPHRLRELAHTKEGLYALLEARFAHRGRKALKQQLQVRFHAHPRAKKGAKR